MPRVNMGDCFALFIVHLFRLWIMMRFFFVLGLGLLLAAALRSARLSLGLSVIVYTGKNRAVRRLAILR